MVLEKDLGFTTPSKTLMTQIVAFLLYFLQEHRFPLTTFLTLLQNTYIAIKFPYLKHMSDGGMGIRINEPSSLIIFNTKREWLEAQKKLDSEPKLNDDEAKEKCFFFFKLILSPQLFLLALKWKEAGNKFFVQEKYPEAIKAYTTGLTSTAHDLLLLSNRAECYIQLKKYFLAYKVFYFYLFYFYL
jgi:tetratricopeptide (TPR) repeat protein